MNAIIINILFISHSALPFWRILYYSQKSRLPPNKYVFRVNFTNLFRFENVFIHSKGGIALDLDFGLSVCVGILNCGFNKKKGDLRQSPVTTVIHIYEKSVFPE